MFLMSYFKSAPAAGMFLAASDYLYDWHILFDGRPVLTPDENHIMRDPSLIRTSDGVFHVFFTDNWESRTIGHSTSRNLVEWSRIKHIPLMAHHPDAMNCWSPSAFYDREARAYRLIWSTGFFYSYGVVENRIWMSTTHDFVDFSKPEPFFDPDYPIIDAFVLPAHDGYRMAFKDDRGSNTERSDYKAIRTCRFRHTGSDFVDVSELITKGQTGAPSLAMQNGRYFLFYEGVTDHVNRLSVSDDFVNWHDETALANFPDECRHASIAECLSSDVRRIW